MNKDMLKDLTLLFVDDEAEITNIIDSSYSGIIKNVIIANDGEAALNKFKELYNYENNTSGIDVIVTDINMPKLNGFKLIETIREIDTKIPMIILSAYDNKEYLKQAIDLKVKGYGLKPLDAISLLDIICSAYESEYLRKNLEKQVEERTYQLSALLDMQDNIVILSDSKKLNFANKKFFDFFGYENLDNFLEYHECICEKFVENDNFFHLKKIDNDKSWIEFMLDLPERERIVTMVDKNFNVFAFSVTINKFNENLYIVNFTDISETILENIELKETLIHDKLTGAFNREYLEKTYHKFKENCKLNNNHLALAFLDIDYFKHVNDSFGHDVGDEVLIEFVNTIKRHTREKDILVRWGGEEFILILEVSNIDNLEKLLEYRRQVVESNEFPTIGQITCSIGGVIYISGEDITSTIKRADEALYEAKNSGRNKVVIRA